MKIVKTCLSAGLVLSLASLGIVPSPARAGEDEKASPEWTALVERMESEGWRLVATRVFERPLTGTKVEHLGYGAEGLAWTIGKLSQQRDRLVAESAKFPSKELSAAIEGLSATIRRAVDELATMSGTAGFDELFYTGASCDPICYGATADAYEQTAQQGVGATASARFTNSCGYSGDTYAYAYARATAGTTTSTITQQDPRTGSSVNSSASASVAGGSISGTPCYSEASAYAQSSTLGISYSTSDVNNGYCPVPANPPSCSINGTSYEYFLNATCRNRTWTASASGGVTPYTYQWKVNGSVVGTGSSYTQSICYYSSGFNLDLVVTGANGLSCTSSRYVYVEYDPGSQCNPICP